MYAYAAARLYGMTSVVQVNEDRECLDFDSIERTALHVTRVVPALQLLEWLGLVGELRCT
jgi:hypothetical protein